MCGELRQTIIRIGFRTLVKSNIQILIARVVTSFICFDTTGIPGDMEGSDQTPKGKKHDPCESKL